MIKMIVTDLDRTLLHTDKTISAYSAAVFARCRDIGIKIVFATARPKRAVTHFCDIIPIDALILHNGALVYVGDEILVHHGISPAMRDGIMRAISRDVPEAFMSVEIDDLLHVNFDMPDQWRGVAFKRTALADLPDRPADKIILGSALFGHAAALNKVQLQKYIPDELYIESTSDQPPIEMIMNRNATKWNAIQTISAHFGINTTEIVAFGDDFNDILMLQGCGVGVAVANAIDEAKAVADHICGANDDDGVAGWLEGNVL